MSIDELVKHLNSVLEQKDKQIEGLAAERDRLRKVVRGLQERHEEDTRKITELLEAELERRENK